MASAKRGVVAKRITLPTMHGSAANRDMAREKIMPTMPSGRSTSDVMNWSSSPLPWKKVTTAMIAVPRQAMSVVRAVDPA